MKPRAKLHKAVAVAVLEAAEEGMTAQQLNDYFTTVGINISAMARYEQEEKPAQSSLDAAFAAEVREIDARVSYWAA